MSFRRRREYDSQYRLSGVYAPHQGIAQNYASLAGQHPSRIAVTETHPVITAQSGAEATQPMPVLGQPPAASWICISKYRPQQVDEHRPGASRSHLPGRQIRRTHWQRGWKAKPLGTPDRNFEQRSNRTSERWRLLRHDVLARWKLYILRQR